MDLRTDFVWTPDWQAEDDTYPRIVYFRKSLRLREEDVEEFGGLRISADSRYKLYINGRFIQEGPQKALDLTQWYVDSVDLTKMLLPGENVIAVEVLRYPAAKAGKYDYNASLLRSETPMLYVKDLSDQATFSARNGWKCCINDEIAIVSEKHPAGPSPVCAQEIVTATGCFAGWKEPGFDDRTWSDPVSLTLADVIFTAAPCKLVQRTIPPMKHRCRRFSNVSALRNCTAGNANMATEQTAAMLRGAGVLTVPANSTLVVEVAANVEENGYLRYSFAGGSGAKLTTRCAECYSYPELTKSVNELPRKGDRTDAVHGTLVGPASEYRVAGWGSAHRPECYEPFWYRTFRYIQLRIETLEEPLSILDFSYRTVGYPLEVRLNFTTDDQELQAIWEICLRTLQLCMVETYMDCPFYEQMQYAMDSRTQMLFTYAISADDRLARQTMEAFRLSQRPDGLLNAQAPSRYTGVIPGFSIYYILMLWDHMRYFGDEALVRLHLPAVDRILSFFDGKLTRDGVVGKIGGGIIPGPFWSFIDWAKGWDGGMPAAGQKNTGNLTMESLLYLGGLEKASELAAFAGRVGLAEEYTQRAERLKAALIKNCTGMVQMPDGSAVMLVQDGCGVAQYSVHCQTLAVLTGLVTPEAGRKMLMITVGNEKYIQPSVAFMFYVFRALEACDLYEQTHRLWEPWRRMLGNNMTTCVENETDERSDCHAWGALMCYELPAAILGVSPAGPGFSAVQIHPKLNLLQGVKAVVPTSKGDIYLTWENQKIAECRLPSALAGKAELQEEIVC